MVDFNEAEAEAKRQVAAVAAVLRDNPRVKIYRDEDCEGVWLHVYIEERDEKGNFKNIASEIVHGR